MSVRRAELDGALRPVSIDLVASVATIRFAAWRAGRPPDPNAPPTLRRGGVRS
jgi:hypothetical protein